MQLVSDLQQRPKKGRLSIEKSIVPFYDLCSAVQLITFLIHTVTTTIGASRTFTRSIIVQNNFELKPALVFKTRECSFSTVRRIYAFDSVQMIFTQRSVNDVFVDQTIQMRLAIFICAVTLAVGGVNRMLVEANVFVIKYRNFYFWKDIISATELLLLAYVMQIAAAAEQPARLLRDYLRFCGVNADSYLPFISAANLWVFAGVGFLTYAVGIVLYLNNALPKYGVMTPQEIDEYKAWLRRRRAEQEQVRTLVDEAKKANARLHLLNNADYKKGESTLVVPPSVPGTTEAMYPYLYGAAYPAAPGTLGAVSGPNLPPPQLFGAGVMVAPVQPAAMPSSPYKVGDQMAVDPPACEVMPPGAMATGSPPPSGAMSVPVNMPRRRIAPSPSQGTSLMYE
ncbi:hypothetical protein LSCM1_06497 [Leishmania martiniquensis]|uniref:Uncharacterized protein n=1 Tax=Leishmania martiniquensis TaxID=1580590 RepID=A0A836GDN4_9TRYP|nr:hypothetical protein LSCM1_06497 [Leishmania martiniquensis]